MAKQGLCITTVPVCFCHPSCDHCLTHPVWGVFTAPAPAVVLSALQAPQLARVQGAAASHLTAMHAVLHDIHIYVCVPAASVSQASSSVGAWHAHAASLMLHSGACC